MVGHHDFDRAKKSVGEIPKDAEGIIVLDTMVGHAMYSSARTQAERRGLPLVCVQHKWALAKGVLEKHGFKGETAGTAVPNDVPAKPVFVQAVPEFVEQEPDMSVDLEVAVRTFMEVRPEDLLLRLDKVLPDVYRLAGMEVVPADAASTVQDMARELRREMFAGTGKSQFRRKEIHKFLVRWWGAWQAGTDPDFPGFTESRSRVREIFGIVPQHEYLVAARVEALGGWATFLESAYRLQEQAPAGLVQLLQEGKIKGVKLGRDWYTSKIAVRDYLAVPPSVKSAQDERIDRMEARLTELEGQVAEAQALSRNIDENIRTQLRLLLLVASTKV